MDDELQKCPVCQSKLTANQGERDFSTDNYKFNCPTCSEFTCTWDAKYNVLLMLPDVDRVRLSGAIRERFETRERREDIPLIESSNVESYLASAPRETDIATKSRKLLWAIARRIKRPGVSAAISAQTDYSLAYAADKAEMVYFYEYLLKLGWICGPYSADGARFEITPTGWEELQKRPRIESVRAFVAMRFHRSTDDAYIAGIKPAIENDCFYKAVRIDAVQFNGDIIDRLMAEIRESRFVVADLTGHRRGVYFEAGFAKGLDIDVIWTCYTPRADRTHFDANHFNQIRWDTPAQLREKLAIRIRATIGLGRFKPNVDT